MRIARVLFYLLCIGYMFNVQGSVLSKTGFSSSGFGDSIYTQRTPSFPRPSTPRTLPSFHTEMGPAQRAGVQATAFTLFMSGLEGCGVVFHFVTLRASGAWPSHSDLQGSCVKEVRKARVGPEVKI